jgi:hypothetical protein
MIAKITEDKVGFEPRPRLNVLSGGIGINIVV